MQFTYWGTNHDWAMTGQNGWCNEYLYIVLAALSSGQCSQTISNMGQMHPFSIQRGGAFDIMKVPLLGNSVIIMKHSTHRHDQINWMLIGS